MDANRLAHILREASRDFATWQGALRHVASLIDEPTYTPAVHWHGPFKHDGNECPVPPETVVRVTLRNGHQSGFGLAGGWLWDHVKAKCGTDIVSFSYAADNPEGWIERPEGWVWPDGVRLKGKFRGGAVLTYDGEAPSLVECITHIRLLPREKADDQPCDATVEPKAVYRGTMRFGSPIHGDVRDVVREALERADWKLTAYVGLCKGDKELTEAVLPLVREALAALDASPAEGETLPEWARVDQRGALWITSPSTYDLCVAASDRTPDEMERMATALSRRAAQLRREGK